MYIFNTIKIKIQIQYCINENEIIMNNQWKKYLFWFAQEHIDFRKAVSSFFI